MLRREAVVSVIKDLVRVARLVALLPSGGGDVGEVEE